MNYRQHLARQVRHQLRAPLGLLDPVKQAARAISEIAIRLVCVPLLPLSPLFAWVALLDERKSEQQRELAKRNVRNHWKCLQPKGKP